MVIRVEAGKGRKDRYVTLMAAGFMGLVTSLAAEIPTAEICAAYRLRRQLEPAFKRSKSLLNIDRIPNRTTAAGLSWLYPHLIFTLMTEDICKDFLDSSPPRTSSTRCAAPAGVSPEL
jgi:hypothetical protein